MRKSKTGRRWEQWAIQWHWNSEGGCSLSVLNLLKPTGYVMHQQV